MFFTFSTTQEYYTMPCYPALALLISSAMGTESVWVKRGTRFLGVIAALAAIAVFVIAFEVRSLPTPGDISNALSSHPKAYSLSLGHMLDITFASFAYLRMPLVIAGIAFLIGVIGNFWSNGTRAFLMSAVMMVVFFHAARLALIVFDPFLTSRPIAEVYRKAPPGRLIFDHHYYTFSSVVFYSGEEPLLLNGKFHNLEYGAAAPDAPPVFLTDSELVSLWKSKERYYLIGTQTGLQRISSLLGDQYFGTVIESGGKLLVTNLPVNGLGQSPPASNSPGLGSSTAEGKR